MFNDSAADFDTHLESLNYRAPQLAEQAVKELYSPSDSLSILDAGCGTGPCGHFLKNIAIHLTGVDLSSEVINLAEQRDCYNTLEVAELTAYLTQVHNKFDLIVYIDTICYFGPLDHAKNGGLVFHCSIRTSDHSPIDSQLNNVRRNNLRSPAM